MAPGGALAEPGPVGEAHLVQDLAGLLLVARVVDPALARGQGAEGVEHEPGAEGPGLVARDQGVASEQRDEPGDAGGQQAPGGIQRVGHAQPVQVGQGAAAAGGQALGIGGHLHVGAPLRARAGPSDWSWTGSMTTTRRSPAPGARARPGSGGPSRRSARLDLVGGRAEVHPRAAAPVLAHEADLPPAVADLDPARRRPSGARQPADLEDVGEVRGQRDDDPHLDLARRPALQARAPRRRRPGPPGARASTRPARRDRPPAAVRTRGTGPSRGGARRRPGAGGARR